MRDTALRLPRFGASTCAKEQGQQRGGKQLHRRHRALLELTEL